MPEYVNLIIMGAAVIIFYFLGRRSAVISPAPVLGPRSENKVIVDTSALIDGRILEVAKTGFVSGKMFIYKFILDELQHIADSSDPLRRAKGRRGLKILGLFGDSVMRIMYKLHSIRWRKKFLLESLIEWSGRILYRGDLY